MALVVVCGLIVGQDGGSVGAALPGFDSAQRTHVTGGKLLILLVSTVTQVRECNFELLVLLFLSYFLC